MATHYPDKSLENGLWGCLCGASVFGPACYIDRQSNEWRIECTCGLAAAWCDSPEDARFCWNWLMAALSGPYSFMELYYRRRIRIERENGMDTRESEQHLQWHIEAYTQKGKYYE